MDEDMLKNWESDDSSMDMMGIMMQMEKFPELSEPFYTLTNADNGSFTTTTTTLKVNPNVTTLTDTMINSPPLISSYNPMTTRSASFYPSSSTEKKSNMAAMREMIFRMAVMQPIHIDPESVKPPKRRNVKISKDPQSVAARHRRERISEKIRTLQRLVPGGTKMDTASMLDEAIHYVKFLKKQVQMLEQAGGTTRPAFNVNYSANLLVRGCQPCQMMGPSSKQMLT